ncbi:GSK3-beta interaction protein [Ditylenchus destructor]|nr:GSK3-beta interaction protein [Ditylenchus destructor]
MVSRALANSAINANVLADTLGVSPLYRQQDTARWQSAAQIYQSSRAHSPVNGGSASAGQFPFNDSNSVEAACTTPRQQIAFQQSYSSCISSPLSLEDIASVNRRRHAQSLINGNARNDQGGSLELEAIAAVHELACSVKSISVSEILPRTADLIFVNIKTYEDHPFTLELTMKGWRIASSHTDSMNGDYSQVEFHTRYFNNARELLDVVSPGHACQFSNRLAERLEQLEEYNNEEEALIHHKTMRTTKDKMISNTVKEESSEIITVYQVLQEKLSKLAQSKLHGKDLFYRYPLSYDY